MVAPFTFEIAMKGSSCGSRTRNERWLLLPALAFAGFAFATAKRQVPQAIPEAACANVSQINIGKATPDVAERIAVQRISQQVISCPKTRTYRVIFDRVASGRVWKGAIIVYRLPFPYKVGSILSQPDTNSFKGAKEYEASTDDLRRVEEQYGRLSDFHGRQVWF
jgi:hypothetical protein